MTGIQNGRTRNLEKPFPGCLGKMVNLFDLSAGMPGNRLLTEKPYRDGIFIELFLCNGLVFIPITQHLTLSS